MTSEEKGFISLKEEGEGDACYWGIFLFLECYYLYVFKNEMSSNHYPNTQRHSFFFSFGTTLKDTRCHVQHPWGLYLISEQDGLPVRLMPDSSGGEAGSGNSIFQLLWQNAE